jgi:hypothetical protein
MRVVALMGIVGCSLALGACTPASKRCEASGGQWYRSSPQVRHDSRTGRCLMPAGDAGKVCRDGSECSLELCQCTNPILTGSDATDRPEVQALDGTEGKGACAAFPPRIGSGWVCAVLRGRIYLKGLLVD